MAKDEITVTKPVLPEMEKYVQYLRKIWSTRWVTNDGEFVRLLQKKLEEYLNCANLVLVSNGTLALHIALRALDLKGEVITTPFTFAATTNVIVWEGLTPVFADIDSETFNIDPYDVENKISEKTSAILAVHTYGNPCDVEALQEIAEAHDLKLVFDAAHAFGVEYKNHSLVKYGDMSTLSFHATKVFNTIEGGAIVAREEQKVENLKLLRNHGIKSEEEVAFPGTNAKMNEFQAAMGLCNLEEIDDNIESRAKIFEHYKESLCCVEQVSFQKLIASKYNFSYMPICLENIGKRDKVYSELLRKGIRSRKYFYPLTVSCSYLKEGDVNLVEKYGLERASDVSDRILCLPIYPDLKANDVDRIIDIVNYAVKG
jgi:dTDP-4-amino-4,6-dideoxygalactose transaminase